MTSTAWKRAVISMALAAAALSLVPNPAVAQKMNSAEQRALQVAAELADKAQALEHNNRWEEALPMRERAEGLLAETFGERNPRLDQARRSLADSLTSLGRFSDARLVLDRLLAMRVVVLGERDPLTADAWNRLGDTHRQEGHWTNALSFYERAEAIATEFPTQVVLRATIANNRALVLDALGDFPGAERLWTQAVALLREPVERQIKDKAVALGNWAEACRSRGRFADAQHKHEQALAAIAGFPPNSPDRLVAEDRLAMVYSAQGQSKRAVEIYHRIIPALVQLRGPDDLNVLMMRRNLARMLGEQRRHKEALLIIDECLERLTRTGRSGHSLSIGLQTDRGDRLKDLGDPEAARQSYLAAINARPDNSVTGDRVVWATRERLALLARDQGEFESAVEQLNQLLLHRREQARSDRRGQEELASTLLEWARFLSALGRIDDTDRCLSEVRDVVERHLGPGHPLAAELWTEAALLARSQGRAEEIVLCHQRALKIRLDAFGEQHSLVAQSRAGLASAMASIGALDPAAREIEIARDIAGMVEAPDSPIMLDTTATLAFLRHRQGRLDDAAHHYERLLSALEKQRSRFLGAFSRDATFLELERGYKERAASLARSTHAHQRATWREILRFGSANDRLSWRGANDVLSALAAIAHDDPLPLAGAVLDFKSAVLDSLIEEAQLAGARSASREQATALREARLLCYRMEMARNTQQPPSTEALRAARAKVEALEGSMARQFTALAENRRGLNATQEGIRKALPSRTALVEFVRFRGALGRGETEPRFGALIFHSSAQPHWVDLGSVGGTNGIAEAVAKWRSTIRRDPPPEGASVTDPLATLYQKIWAPLVRAMPANIDTVIVSPDGELNFVPFAALWANGRFLGEDLAFRYVASGRDLLLPDYTPPNVKRVCILAAPEFARPGWERRVVAPLRDKWKEWINVLSLRGSGANEILPTYSALPGTREEATTLAELARKNGCQHVQTFIGKEADEASLIRHPTPYVLHFATHGTFLGTPTVEGGSQSLPGSASRPLVLPNPMHRSWVALARANETIQEWQAGRVPDPLHDGVLTAEEVSQLAMEGTWLVTLSACDTGLGLPQPGEGVFGLRRAFALAGARHVLMTLWPVNDLRTRQFMQAFYDDALRTGDAPGALARIQKRLLQEWRKSEGSGRAARFAGAFVISSRGL